MRSKCAIQKGNIFVKGKVSMDSAIDYHRTKM